MLHHNNNVIIELNREQAINIIFAVVDHGSNYSNSNDMVELIDDAKEYILRNLR